MADDSNWKVVERSCLVIGTIAAVGALGFEALNYFKEPGTPKPAVVPQFWLPTFSLPVWTVIIVTALAALLLGTGWMMFIERRRRERRASAQPPSIEWLQRVHDRDESESPSASPSLAGVWSKVDPIRLYDAASLWVGEDPEALYGHVLIGAAGGMLKRLEQAHVDGLITARRSYGVDFGVEAGEWRGAPPFGYVVPRKELIALAESWGERPNFLFPD